MASRVYSVDEVISEVFDDSDRNEDEIEPDVKLQDVINSSVARFYPLRHKLVNYSNFCEEASRCLESVYQRHEIENNDQTEKVLSAYANVRPIIKSEVQIWLKNIRRRMRANPTPRNPWTVNFTRDLPEEVFECIKRAIAGGASAFGVVIGRSCIQFTEMKRLVRDMARLSQFTQSEITNEHLKKLFKLKKFTTHVKVSVENPFEISYDYKKLKMSVACKYECVNEFGYSFG